MVANPRQIKSEPHQRNSIQNDRHQQQQLHLMQLARRNTGPHCQRNGHRKTHQRRSERNHERTRPLQQGTPH